MTQALIQLGAGQHARLSPSAAHRWIPCPGSLYHPPGPDSEAAQRGTHQHRVLELVLTGEPALVGDVLPDTGRRIERHHLAQAQEVLAFLDEHYPEPAFDRWTERKVEIGAIAWPEVLQPLECAGTVDVSARSSNRLLILDAKFGAIQIEPLQNPQLILYALGLLTPEIEVIDFIIAQPNFDGEVQFKHWPATRKDIQAWERDNLDKILNARDGSRTLSAGDWCKWCSGRATCPAYTAAYQDFMQAEWISGHSLEEMLPYVEQLRDVCNALEEKAYRELSLGREVPGYKLVQSNKHAQFVDEEHLVVKKALTLDPTLDPSDLYALKLKSPAQLKKMIGKKLAAQIETFKPQGAPTLVKDSDPRPALGASDFTLLEGLQAELDNEDE